MARTIEARTHSHSPGPLVGAGGGAHQADAPGFYPPIFLEAGQTEAILDLVSCLDRMAMITAERHRETSVGDNDHQ